MKTIIYEYGIRLDRECLNDMNYQFRLANRLYNDCIAHIRAMREGANQWLLQHSSELQAIQASIEVAQQKFDLAKAANHEPGMKEAAQERKELYKRQIEVSKPLRKRHQAELSELFFNSIGLKKECKTYQLRCNAVEAGLGSATADEIHATALAAWDKVRKAGGQLSFRTAERTQDHIIVRFTQAGGIPAEELLTGRHAAIQMMPAQHKTLGAGCGDRFYGEFKFRLGAARDDTYATGTYQYHRPLPEGSRASKIRLVRKRIGPDWRYSLQIQLAVDDYEPITIPGKRKPLATIHTGWRLDEDGRRQIAALADAADPGFAQLIQLPESIVFDLFRSEKMQAERDTDRDSVHAAMKTLSAPDYWMDDAKEEWDALRKLPAQRVAVGRIVRLHKRLMGCESAAAQLIRDFSVSDRWKWQAQQHVASTARNRRKNWYRELAKDLVRQYETLIMAVPDLKESAKRIDDKGERNELGQKARSARHMVALYELHQALDYAATRAGSVYIRHEEMNHAKSCAVCGNEISTDGDYVRCDCGNDYARKQNAAAMLYQIRSAGIDADRREILEKQQAKESAAAEKKAKKLESLQFRRAEKRSLERQDQPPAAMPC